MRDIYENFDIIPENKNVVIWGINQKTWEIFCETLNRRIKITYFVDTKNGFDEKGEKKQIFGKRILTKKELLDKKNNIFILVEKDYVTTEELQWLDEYCKDLYYLCSAADVDKGIRNSRRLYLYGGGHSGRRTYKILEERGISVSAFLDSDYKKWNKQIADDTIDAMVYGPDIIEEDDVIIVSTRYYYEIKKTLSQRGISENNIYIDIRNSWEYSDIPIRYRDRVKLWFEYAEMHIVKGISWLEWFWVALTDFYGKKKVILYGMNEFASQFLEVFTLLNIEVIYYTDDVRRSDVIKSGGVEVKYRDLYELPYEDMSDKIVYMVKVDVNDNKIETADYTKLERLGIKYFKEIRPYDNPFYSTRNPRVDPGFGWKRDELLINTIVYKNTSIKYPGYIVLGNEETAKKRIVILGGSTSDVGLYEYFIKSWPEFLYEKMEDVVLFCGGMAQYNSKQELLKLLRDGEQLRPDLVISYSGLNDLGQPHTEEYPFARKKVTDRLLKHETFGIKKETLMSKEWVESEKLMYLLANYYKSDFIGIFQPILINKHKNCMTLEEKVIYECSREWRWSEVEVGEYKRYQINVKRKIQDISYICDMTDLFSNEKAWIFRDTCHLTEEGNHILANKIYDLIHKKFKVY